MKTILTAMLLLCAQQRPSYDAVQLVHEEHKLNSGGRIGGQSRAMIRIDVPPHATHICYAISASPRNPLQDLGLTTHLHEMIAEGKLKLGVSTAILDDMTLPSADGVADVMIIKDSTNADRYTKKLADAHSIAQYSRTNVSNALVSIPVSDRTPLYLCVRNPTLAEAEYITVEVTAIIKK